MPHGRDTGMPRRGARGSRSSESPPPARKRDIVWWSAEPGGRKKAQEEFEDLPDSIRGKLLQAMLRYRDGVSRREDVKKLDRDIWEWRARNGNNHFRVLFFVWGNICVAVTAFYKNKQQTPSEDIQRANDRRKVWLKTRGVTPPHGWQE
ncbi:type II toxin-antitoxin system RelE/ParE family toxin [Nostocoides sp. F2B08]|nr:type II toxin-antitoxin system RelE/ParE family toxin [Tetrasphaera sp. F2B08]